MAEERDFLSRWSKRKTDAREGRLDEEAEVAGRVPEPEPETGKEPVSADPAEPAEVPIPPELEGIDIDSLGYDADFTVFMKAGVPEALRRKALRRLWRSDPVLACLDGLNDYEEDFTDAAVAVKGLESAYRVGKGYLFAEDEAPKADEGTSGDDGGPDENDQVGKAHSADADEVGPDVAHEIPASDETDNKA